MRSATKTNLFHRVDELIDSLFPDLVAMRRHLHMHPELSWEEEHTTRLIREAIEKLGLSFKPGPRHCGGICDVQWPATESTNDESNSRVLAIRGDIDAIPVFEQNEVDYCSRYDEVMHACGHDVHGTVVYGVCNVLTQLIKNEELPYPVHVRAIFQPAEEVAEGADEMVQLGALNGVDAILTMHVDSQRDVGRIGLKEHVQTACCTEIQIEITAEGGHAARPHETADSILTAAQFISAAYAQVPRSIDVRKSAVLSFCRIDGGKSANVIPTNVTIQGTLRTFDDDVRDHILERLQQIANHLGAALGAEIAMDTGVRIPSVNNHPDFIDLYRRAGETFLEPSSIDEIAPSMGAEDFACYLKHVPGAMVRVGCANGDFGNAPLHSPHFDVDEEVIRVGCRLFVRAILLWFE